VTAFKYQHVNQINENIKVLFNRLKAVSKMTITHEEFLQLFVPAEHRDTYRSIAVLAETGSSFARFGWGDTHLRLRLNHQTASYPPPIPRSMILQHDAPEELVERIKVWMISGGDASRDFGRVRAVFNMLNEKLTKAQVRFVWPSIMALCNVNDTLAPLALELQDLKAAGGAALPRGLLLACRKTAATISMTCLLPTDVASRDDAGEVTITTADGAEHCEDGIDGFYGMS
jgi:hypothetical protein